MSNKNIFKELYSKKISKEKNHYQILEAIKKKENNKMIKRIKYAIIPICFLMVAFIGISLNKGENTFIENVTGTMKVYAYTLNEYEKIEKTELKDNIKLGLVGYNLAMSSVPGYPIIFEMDDVDSLNIDVTNGSILDWDSNSGTIDNLGNTYQLSIDKTLYFKITADTNIKITVLKNQNKILEKKIEISSDKDYNYYATLK